MLSLVPAAAAGANTGVGNVEFQVSGTLADFPCTQGGCVTNFDTNTSKGIGSGNALATINGDPYNAVFTIFNGTVSGSASYSELDFPLCPLVGFASTAPTGTITLSGGATGVIYNLDDPLHQGGGVVTSVTTHLNFTYSRVGLLTTVIAEPGSYVTVNYYFPTTGPDVH